MHSEEQMERQQWARDVAARLEAGELLADYVADLIDYHQGYRPDAPHADLEELGAAVHTINGKRSG